MSASLSLSLPFSLFFFPHLFPFLSLCFCHLLPPVFLSLSFLLSLNLCLSAFTVCISFSLSQLLLPPVSLFLQPCPFFPVYVSLSLSLCCLSLAFLFVSLPICFSFLLLLIPLPPPPPNRWFGETRKWCWNARYWRQWSGKGRGHAVWWVWTTQWNLIFNRKAVSVFIPTINPDNSPVKRTG